MIPMEILQILTASGGPFSVANPATFTPVILNNDTVLSHFTWATDCNNVRTQPYSAQFKAQDTDTTRIGEFENCSDSCDRFFTSPSIRLLLPNGKRFNSVGVLLPAPMLSVTEYTKVGMFNGTIECPCDNGAPSYAGGYSLIGHVLQFLILILRTITMGTD